MEKINEGRANMQSFNNLPWELLLEILIRLPVKSLKRFECVCKSWYAFINNPEFISIHLKHNSCNNEIVLVKRCLLTCFGKKENVFTCISNKESSFSSVNVDLGLQLYKKDACLQVIGHCDGIICMSNYRNDIVLCNPATKESMVVPKSCLSFKTNLIPQTNALGFGFDIKNRTHKVVRVVSCWEEHSRVEVYTMETDSWREIKGVKVPVIVQFSPSFETYFNGAFHWHAMDHNNEEVILSFNMGQEDFQTISMPGFVSCQDSSISRSLLVWNSCLALIAYPRRGIEKEFQISVMENYGLMESWTRKICVGPLTGVEMPLMFWRNGDEILMEGIDGQTVSYNFITKQVRYVQIYGVPKSFQILTYVNSLVPIRRSNVRRN